MPLRPHTTYYSIHLCSPNQQVFQLLRRRAGVLEMEKEKYILYILKEKIRPQWHIYAASTETLYCTCTAVTINSTCLQKKLARGRTRCHCPESSLLGGVFKHKTPSCSREKGKGKNTVTSYALKRKTDDCKVVAVVAAAAVL